MRAVNLLPRQAVRERKSGSPSILPLVGAAAVPVIAICLVGFGYAQEQSIVASKQHELSALQAQAVKLAPAPTQAPPGLSLLASDRQLRLSELQAVLAQQFPWDTTLVQFARALPANVWLTSITAVSPTPADVVPPAPAAPVAAGTTQTPNSSTTPAPAPAPIPAPVPPPSLTIDGYTHTQDDVAAVLSRLQLLPSLSNVSLASIDHPATGSTSIVEFQITAVFNAPSQAAPVFNAPGKAAAK